MGDRGDDAHTTGIRAGLDKQPADVAAMFDRVARRYDVTNTVLSGGLDAGWRRATREALDPRPGQVVLDVAAGTAVSTVELAGTGATAIALDFSQGMLRAGASRPAGADLGGNATAGTPPRHEPRSTRPCRAGCRSSSSCWRAPTRSRQRPTPSLCGATAGGRPARRDRRGRPRNVRFDPGTNRPAMPVGTAEASWGSPRYAADCC